MTYHDPNTAGDLSLRMVPFAIALSLSRGVCSFGRENTIEALVRWLGRAGAELENSLPMFTPFTSKSQTNLKSFAG